MNCLGKLCFSTKVQKFTGFMRDWNCKVECQQKARATKILLFPPTDTSPSGCFLQLPFVILASVFFFTSGCPSVLLVVSQYAAEILSQAIQL